MDKHYTIVRQEKTKIILDRALDFLITCHPPVDINNKLQKKINMSYSQVIDAMNHVATKEEMVEDLIWKDSSSVSYYKGEVNSAKVKRAELEISSGDFKIERQMSELELQLKIEQLMIANHNLKRELSCLKSAVSEAELNIESTRREQFSNQTGNTIESTKHTSLMRITKKILEELSGDKKISITKSETNGVVENYSYNSKDKRKSVVICNKSELDSLLEIGNTAKELLS